MAKEFQADVLSMSPWSERMMKANTETSALKLFTVVNFSYQLVDSTKLSI